MKGALAALLLLHSLCTICEGMAPEECYLCQSLTTSKVCGDGFHYMYPSTVFCRANQHYCMKLVETAGRFPVVYRKCTSNTCEEEKEMRLGTVNECFICTTKLCNAAYSIFLSSITLPYLVPLVIFLYQRMT